MLCRLLFIFDVYVVLRVHWCLLMYVFNITMSLRVPAVRDSAVEVSEKLLEAEIVFRTFEEPLGDSGVLPGIPYSIKGKFIRKDDGFLFTCDNAPIQVRVIVNL